MRSHHHLSTAAGLAVALLIGAMFGASIDSSPPEAEASETAGAALTDVGREALRFCESRHQYDVTSPGGRYHGAYQFNIQTWNQTLEWMHEAGYEPGSDWLGYRAWIDADGDWLNLPSTAPFWVQDHAATWLWNNDPEGISSDRWPVCQHFAFDAMALTPDKRVAALPEALAQQAAPVPVATG